MPSESFIGVAPDGTGKKVRNRSDDLAQPDGTTATVNTQIVAMAEADRRLFLDMHRTLKKQLAASLLILQILNESMNLDDVNALADTLEP